jgi:hypothetical protein
VHRELPRPHRGQQALLDLAGELELLAHAFLLDQLGRHAGVVDGERGGRSHGGRELHVGEVEEPVSAALVEQLERAQALAPDRERRAQNRARGEARVGIHHRGEARVLGHVADDLGLVVHDGLADDALIGCQTQATDVDRTGAFTADEHAIVVLEQEDRGCLGVEVDHEPVDGVLERRVDVQRAGELVGELRQEDRSLVRLGTQYHARVIHRRCRRTHSR